MKLRNYVLYVGMAIVLISLIGNYLFFSVKQLKQPIMLKHYYDIPFQNGFMLELHYLVNRNEDVDIQMATVPGTEIILSPTFESHAETYRHYKLKTMYVRLEDYMLGNIPAESLRFNEITAHLSNGESVAMDIGEISFFKPTEAALQFKASGGSSDNSGFYIVEAEKNIELSGINIPYFEDLKSALSLRLNQDQVELKKSPHRPGNSLFSGGQPLRPDLFPITLQKGESLSINFQFSFKENDPIQRNFYQINGKLEEKKQNGPAFTTPFNLTYRPYLNEKDIQAIVKGANND